MKIITNRFGTGILYDETDLGKSIYCVCTACMSVWSNFLSFANSELLKTKDVTAEYVKNDPAINETDTIVILGHL